MVNICSPFRTDSDLHVDYSSPEIESRDTQRRTEVRRQTKKGTSFIPLTNVGFDVGEGLFFCICFGSKTVNVELFRPPRPFLTKEGLIRWFVPSTSDPVTGWGHVPPLLLSLLIDCRGVPGISYSFLFQRSILLP